MPSLVVHAFNPSIPEAEMGTGQPGLQSSKSEKHCVTTNMGERVRERERESERESTRAP